MTIEELKTIKWYVDEEVHTKEIAEKLHSIIDEKISQSPATDEVTTFEDLQALIGTQIVDLPTFSVTTLQQMQKEPQVQTKRLDYHGQDEVDGDWKEPCEYCNGEMEQFFEIIDANFCMRCGRKLM